MSEDERPDYRLLDGHDAGDGEETCDETGCNEQPAYVRLATGEWICPEHAVEKTDK